MPLVEMNFDDTPDKMLPVEAGVRLFKITDFTEEENDLGEKIRIVELEVLEGDDAGRKAWDRFNFKYKPAMVKFKQLVKSAGLPAVGQGIDSSMLIGQTVRAVVKPRTYKDKTTNETKETTQVAEYLFEAATV